MSAAKVSPNRLASLQNPIIGDAWRDTLGHAACAVAFMARGETELAEAALLAETTGSRCPETLMSNEQRGKALLLDCIAAALWFELEGRCEKVNATHV